MSTASLLKENLPMDAVFQTVEIHGTSEASSNDPGKDENDLYAFGEVDPEETTCDVPYWDILTRQAHPWFMEGVYKMQQEDVSYPKTSHAIHRRLAEIHREHPRIMFSFSIEPGDAPATIEGFEMTVYESAGLWADENEHVCLVVLAAFEDDEEGMYLLYEYNLVDGPEDIEEECQWCVVPEEKKTKKN